MSVPKVAILGRPNVGKSSLFNWLAGRFISVVDPTAGVTRDRVEHLVQEGDRYFELIDTGGIGIEDIDDLTEQIEDQIRIAIEQADLLLFVVDGSSGPMTLDVEVAERLRRIDKPKLLVVNKCDSTRTDAEVHEFRRLCEGPLIVTSVKANRNRDELLTAIVENLPPASDVESSQGAVLAAEPELKLAIVGRRNVGKSTFINALAESERVIVSEVPGTTRDSVDIRFEVDGKRLLAIDTPGVRKLVNLAQNLFKQTRIRVSTGKLNRLVRQALLENQPPLRKNRRAKVYYVTQVSTEPPTIVLKCNDPAVFDEAWKRYLLTVLHESLPFCEVPIRLYFRQRDKPDETAPSLEEAPEPAEEIAEEIDDI
jgi:small GTP-binding protein